MDPLSDILALLRPRSYVSAGFDAGGDWCLHFGRYAGIKFNAIIAGTCWLRVENGMEPVRLEAGDCFLLAHGLPFRMGGDLNRPGGDAATLFGQGRPGAVVTLNGGGDFFLAGSRFMLEGGHADLLLGVLPPLVLIRKEQDQAVLRWALDRMRREMQEGRPGGSLVVEHLAHLMLVQALRLYLNDSAENSVGWLYALADRKLGAAIGLMHAEPARRWTLQNLAQEIGMSRTAFALRFKAMVGQSPMEYLTRWRMLLAADRLRHSPMTLPDIAAMLGYESDSAFGVAFKRMMGMAPRAYARAHAKQPVPVPGPIADAAE